MELYSHSKLSTVYRERLELLKNCNLIQVVFTPFNPKSPLSYLRSPEAFNTYCGVFYLRQTDLFVEPDGFAPSPCQPSGKSVGQGGN